MCFRTAIASASSAASPPPLPGPELSCRYHLLSDSERETQPDRTWAVRNEIGGCPIACIPNTPLSFARDEDDSTLAQRKGTAPGRPLSSSPRPATCQRCRSELRAPLWWNCNEKSRTKEAKHYSLSGLTTTGRPAQNIGRVIAAFCTLQSLGSTASMWPNENTLALRAGPFRMSGSERFHRHTAPDKIGGFR